MLLVTILNAVLSAGVLLAVVGSHVWAIWSSREPQVRRPPVIYGAGGAALQASRARVSVTDRALAS